MIDEALPRVIFAGDFPVIPSRCQGHCSRQQTWIESESSEDVESEGRHSGRAADNDSSVDFEKTMSGPIV